jgi:2-aminoadipate transaminase
MKRLLAKALCTAHARAFPTKNAELSVVGVATRLVRGGHERPLGAQHRKVKARKGTEVAVVTDVQTAIEQLQRSCAGDPHVLSLSGGLPADETFPVQDLARSLAEIGPSDLQYDWPEGRLELRRWIVGRLRSRGAEVKPEDVLITNGAQQAIDIALLLCSGAGDAIAVPKACYPAGLDLFRSRDVTPVHELIAATAIYTMPSIANPTGLPLTGEERAALLASSLPIIEDDAYAELRFDRLTAAPLLAAAPDRVYHVGTLSKTLCPGLRVGWLVVPPGERDNARRAKQISDLQANTLTQAIAEKYLARENFDERLDSLASFYAERCAALTDALRRKLPWLRLRDPAGGFAVWVETDEAGDDTEFLATAARHGVSVDPGGTFRASSVDEPLAFRLAFSSLPASQMEEAVGRLAAALFEYQKQSQKVRRAAGVAA